MSAIFILKYSGQPLRVADLTLVPAEQATQFTSEAEAWLAAQQNGLALAHCRVMTRDAAIQEEVA